MYEIVEGLLHFMGMESLAAMGRTGTRRTLKRPGFQTAHGT